MSGAPTIGLTEVLDGIGWSNFFDYISNRSKLTTFGVYIKHDINPQKLLTSDHVFIHCALVQM